MKKKKLRKRLHDARQKTRAIVDSLILTRERKERAVRNLHHIHDDILEKREQLGQIRKNIDEQKKKKDPNWERIRELEDNQKAVVKRLSELTKKLDSKEVKRDRLVARAHRYAEARKWWIKRRTKLRKKLKKAREKSQQGGQPQYQSWMANGHPDNVNQEVKNFIARGVVNYGLYCTSLYRNYVPPGGSTTSYHLQGRAGDIAGSRMTEFQISEYNRNLGNSGCLELFGPDNSRNLKYGNSLYLAEGSGLENLHDTHVHGAF